MAKVELKVVDPKLLEGGTNEQPVQMIYGDTDSPIVIDTDTAFIECEAQGKSAPIKDWVVDFGSHKMKLSAEEGNGDYRAIDPTTALGMVGQLTQTIGIQCLQKFLSAINPPSGDPLPNPPVDNPPSGDPPAENPPPTEESPELPSPIDVDLDK